MKAKKAFSLIEVLLVILVLAVLASVVIPCIAESAGEAKAAKCDSNRANLISALERCAAIEQNGKFPANQLAFDFIVRTNTDYFPHGVPIRPYGVLYAYDNALFTVIAHNH